MQARVFRNESEAKDRFHQLAEHGPLWEAGPDDWAVQPVPTGDETRLTVDMEDTLREQDFHSLEDFPATRAGGDWAERASVEAVEADEDFQELLAASGAKGWDAYWARLLDERAA